MAANNIVHDKICPFHHQQRAALENAHDDIKILYSKVNTAEKGIIQQEGQFKDHSVRIKENTDELEKLREDNTTGLEKLREETEKQLIKIQYKSYVAATTSGIIAAVIIKLIEFLFHLIK